MTNAVASAHRNAVQEREDRADGTKVLMQPRFQSFSIAFRLQQPWDECL